MLKDIVESRSSLNNSIQQQKAAEEESRSLNFKNLDNLKNQHEQWKQLNNQRQTYNQQLVELKANVSITEARQAKVTYEKSEDSKKQIIDELQKI